MAQQFPSVITTDLSKSLVENNLFAIQSNFNHTILASPSVSKKIKLRSANILYVKHDAAGDGDGSSWKDAFDDLQDAINNASPGDQIWVSQGTYKPKIIKTPTDDNYFVVNKLLKIYGGFKGIENTLEQRDWEANPTILSGDTKGDDTDDDFTLNKSDNTAHVIIILPFDGQILDGFEVSYGNTRKGTLPKTGFHLWLGAGIYCRDATIRNCIIRQNSAKHGGGIYSAFGNKINIENCIFRNNQVEGYAGGLNIGNINASITSCTFKGNIANDGVGGGIFTWQNDLAKTEGNVVTISHTTFHSNTASRGAGIQFNNFNKESVLNINNCNFNSNTASLHGGGLYYLAQEFNSYVNINHSIFDFNSAGDNGGAIYCTPKANAIILKDFSQLTIKNSLIHHNTGKYAIYNAHRIDFVNTTIVDNANGLYLKRKSNTTFQNSLLKNNLKNISKESATKVLSKGGNMSSDNTMVNFLIGDGSYKDYNNVFPQLDINYAPLENSPCIDAGNPTGITSTKDLAGNDRIQAMGIDIGAYEGPFMIAVKDVIWDSETLKVYPNPVENILRFVLEDEIDGKINVQLYDNSGRLILNMNMTSPTESNIYELDVQSIIQGTHYVMITSSNAKYIQKIVKL